MLLTMLRLPGTRFVKRMLNGIRGKSNPVAVRGKTGPEGEGALPLPQDLAREAGQTERKKERMGVACHAYHMFSPRETVVKCWTF